MDSPTPNNPAGLQQPGGSQPAANEPVIHVIPDKFYGAALKKRVAKEPPKPPVPPPVAPPGPAKPPLPKKKSKMGLVIAVIIFVLLAGGGGAAYFLFFAKKPAPPANENLNTAPPSPVCGNSKCESPTETSSNCSADCGPPPPVCGDSKCESPTETSSNCSADCGPPPPVCGDKKCEGDETVDSCAADCTPPEPVAGTDSDSDGLSDLEETEIYGTNIHDANTDKDSFVDLNEVLNLFDPATPAPSELRNNPGITVYTDATQGYEIYRPTAWTVKDEDPKQVMFNAPSGEFIEVLVQDKPSDQSLMDWYLAQAPGVKSSDVEAFKTRQGYDEVLSPDRMTAFVAIGAHVYVISYNLGGHTVINYKVTHQMMVNSLKAK